MKRPFFRATIFGAKARTVLAVPLRLLSITSRQSAVLHLQQRHPALDGGVGHHDVDLAVVALDLVGDLAQRGDVADIGLDGLACAGRMHLISRTVSSSSSGVAGTAFEAGETGPAISMATTSAPLAANSTAMARPMPRAAPVTTATLPASIEPRPGRIGPALRSARRLGHRLAVEDFRSLVRAHLRRR